MNARRAAIASLAAALALSGAAGAAAIDTTTVREIRVGEGFPHAALGMTGAQVVRGFGRPTARDDVQLTYDQGRSFFVAFVLRNGRVREIRANAGRFCTPEGVCTNTAGGVRRLRAAYGRAVHQVFADDGARRLGVRRTVNGVRTTTNFVVSSLAGSGRVQAIEISRCPGATGC